MSTLYDDEAKIRSKPYALMRVQEDGDNLKNFLYPIRNDEEVVLAAIRQCGYSLAHASERLRKDRNIVLQAVRNHGGALCYADGEFKDDKSIVIEAVREEGYAIEFASDRLKSDREVAKEALKSDGMALKLLKKVTNFDSDLEMVCTAVRQNPNSIKYIDRKIENNRIIWYEASKVPTNEFYTSFLIHQRLFVPTHIENDEEIWRNSIDSDSTGRVFEMAVKRFTHLKDEKELVLQEVQKKGILYKSCISDRLKRDRDIVLAAVTQNGTVILSVPSPFGSDREVIIRAIGSDVTKVSRATEEMMNDKSFILEIVARNPNLLVLRKFSFGNSEVDGEPYIPKKYLTDKDVIFASKIGVRNLKLMGQDELERVVFLHDFFTASLSYGDQEEEEETSILLPKMMDFVSFPNGEKIGFFKTLW